MANKRSKGQLELLKLIRDKRNLPNKNEIFDIYVGYARKEFCGMVGSGIKPFYYEAGLNELKDASLIWYRSALGSIIDRGELNLVL